MNVKHILVVGGGISGITTAVEIAEVGHNVTLVEQLPYLGGKVAQVNQYFPKLCPPYCGLEINFQRIRQNPRLKFLTSSTIKSISGAKGNFTVKISKSPSYINNNCTSCGECSKICPEERPNSFNYNIDKTKAVYMPHEMAFPWKYTIDIDYCKKESCNKCVEVCKYEAINLKAKEEDFELNVHSIVFATGWKPYDASKIETLGFSGYTNVVTNVIMERLPASNGPKSGKIQRPSDNETPKTIAFVQCAGSRDENHLPYCSAVCCSASFKQALHISETYPDTKIKIFYIDLRVSGRNEDFLQKVQERDNIELIKGKVALINEAPDTNNLILEAEDVMSGKKVKEEVEMAVLATGIVPANPNIIQLKFDEIGFTNNDINEAGIYAVGCSKKPLDVSTSLKDATGMALKAIQ